MLQNFLSKIPYIGKAFLPPDEEDAPEVLTVTRTTPPRTVKAVDLSAALLAHIQLGTFSGAVHYCMHQAARDCQTYAPNSLSNQELDTLRSLSNRIIIETLTINITESFGIFNYEEAEIIQLALGHELRHIKPSIRDTTYNCIAHDYALLTTHHLLDWIVNNVVTSIEHDSQCLLAPLISTVEIIAQEGEDARKETDLKRRPQYLLLKTKFQFNILLETEAEEGTKCREPVFTDKDIMIYCTLAILQKPEDAPIIHFRAGNRVVVRNKTDSELVMNKECPQPDKPFILQDRKDPDDDPLYPL